MTKSTADLDSTNLGTIITIQPRTARGRQWMFSNVPDSRARMNRSVDCEHRAGVDILTGALADGLTLRDTTTGRQAVRS